MKAKQAPLWAMYPQGSGSSTPGFTLGQFLSPASWFVSPFSSFSQQQSTLCSVITVINDYSIHVRTVLVQYVLFCSAYHRPTFRSKPLFHGRLITLVIYTDQPVTLINSTKYCSILLVYRNTSAHNNAFLSSCPLAILGSWRSFSMGSLQDPVGAWRALSTVFENYCTCQRSLFSIGSWTVLDFQFIVPIAMIWIISCIVDHGVIWVTH